MKQNLKRFAAALLSFTMAFNSNMMVFADDDVKDTATPEPTAVAQEEVKEEVIEEETPAPEPTASPTAVPTAAPTVAPTAAPVQPVAPAAAEHKSYKVTGIFSCAEDKKEVVKELSYLNNVAMPTAAIAELFDEYTWSEEAYITKSDGKTDKVTGLASDHYVMKDEKGVESDVYYDEVFAKDVTEVTVYFTYNKNTPEETKEDTEEEIIEEETEEENPEVKGYFEGDFGDIIVRADAYDNANLPADAELHADYLFPGSAAYITAVADIIRNTQFNELENTEYVLYDIYFTSKGERIEPNDYVKVTIIFKDALKAKRENGYISSAEVVHVDTENKTAEVVTDEVIISNGNIEAATFTNNTFSPYGVAYTVDYSYTEEVEGEVIEHTWSMQGETEIYLTQLFEMLGIEADAYTAANVEFTNSDYLQVFKMENGNWLLVSMMPFDTEETLTVTLQDGTVIKIKVTDEQSGESFVNATTSTNLMDYLTGMTIGGITPSGGSYSVVTGKDYAFYVSFAENDNLQFPTSGNMTLQIPEGIILESQSGTVDINVEVGGETRTVKGNTFTVDPSTRVLTYTWNTSDPNFSFLNAAKNARFAIKFSGSFDGSKNQIDFKGDTTLDINVNTAGEVSAYKYANVEKTANKVHYTLVVSSTGLNKNVEVTDAITSTGDFLALDSTSIRAKSSLEGSKEYTPEATVSGNTFTSTIPSMKDGEKVTFTYDATINPDKIPEDTQTYEIKSSGNNAFTVKSKQDPDPYESDINTYIDYTPTVNKSGKVNEDGKTVTWTVKVNEGAAVSMNGKTLTDFIKENSQDIMKYSGLGITIQKQDASGQNVGDPIQVSWSDSKININPETAKRWSYQFTDSEKYQYVITYTTEVNATGKSAKFVVNNEVEVGPRKSTGSAEILPVGDEVQLTKTVENINVPSTGDKTITWSVKFNVPATGLSKAIVTDKFPEMWIDQQHVFEQTKIESITGLVSGTESYSQSGDDEKVVITFYKDQNKTQQGLINTETARVITVNLKTTVNEDWFKQNAFHENNATLELDGSTLTAKATATVMSTEVDKSVSYAGTRNVDGVELPYYKYEIYLTNVNSDENIIHDTFDTNLLEPYVFSDAAKTQYFTWDANSIFGGNFYYQGEQGGKFNYAETSDGMTITTTKDSMPHDSSSSSGFYSKYKLVYYLAVKNADALNTIMSRAAANKGTYTINNSAEWNGKTKTTGFDYNYEIVKKEMITSESELTKTDEDIFADFKLTLNPGAQTLNGGEPLILTDTFTNLSIIYTSITATPSDNVSWDVNGNTTTFKIPDSTKVVITYRARVTFDTIGEPGQTIDRSISNVATMSGYTSDIEKVAKRINEGARHADIYSIKMLKYEGGNMTRRLEGAVFALLDSNKQPIKDKNGEDVTFTTDENGEFEVKGDQDNLGWALGADTLYYLREIKAPKGFALSTFDYSFTISSDGTTDYAKYKYHNGDQMSAKNYEGTQVDVEKIWADGNDNHRSDTVTVKLQKSYVNPSTATESDWSDEIKVLNNDMQWVTMASTDTSVALNTANDWKHTFKSKYQYGLPIYDESQGDKKLVYYRVIESTSIGGYASKITFTAEVKEDGKTSDYHYTITNTPVGSISLPLSGYKRITGNREIKAGEFTFLLTPQTSGDTNVAQRVTNAAPDAATGKASFTFRDLVYKKEGTFVYKISELNNGLPGVLYSDEEYTLTVNVTLNSETSQLEETHTITNKSGEPVSDIEVFFNNNYESGDVSFKKLVNGVVIDTNKSFTFNAELKYNGVGINGDYVVEIDNGSSSSSQTKTIKNGNVSVSLKHNETATIKDLPVGTSFVIKEVVPDGFTVDKDSFTGTIAKGTTISSTFTNTDHRDGSLNVRKVIRGNAAKTSDRFTIKVTFKDANGNPWPTTTTVINDVTFTDGVGTFELAGDEYKTFEHISTGVLYEVEETNNLGYIAKYYGQVESDEKRNDKWEGTIVTDKIQYATVENTKDLYGGLKITKTVPGEESTSESFSFNVTISDTTFTGNVMVGTESVGAFKNGKATFSLTNGQTAFIKGLGNGVLYTVTETKPETDFPYIVSYTNQTGSVVGKKPTPDGVEITDVDQINAVSVTNTRTGQFTLLKNVEGSISTEKEFTFTVKMTDAGGQPITAGTYGDFIFNAAGEATVKLKHGQSATATGIPSGAKYTVTENDTGYIVKVNGVEVTDGKYSGTIQDTPTVVYNNSELGALEIAKVTTGNDKDKKTWFAFKVELTQPLTGTYGDVKFVEGKSAGPASIPPEDQEDYGNGKVPAGYFKVRPATPVLIKDLPAGVGYTVTEDDYSETYDSVTYVNREGTIAGISGYSSMTDEQIRTAVETAGINKVTVTNERNRWGKLRIEKELTGDKADDTLKFKIDIDIADGTTPLADGVYDGVEFKNGHATVEITGGEMITITGLPLGYKFTVTEKLDASDVPGGYTWKSYTLKYRSKEKGEEEKTEKTINNRNWDYINVDQRTVVVSNIYTVKGHVNLSAIKKVNGETPTSDQKYSFTLNSSDATGKVVAGVGQTISNTQEKVTFNQINYNANHLGGTYYYVMQESMQTGSSVIIDQSKYLVKVVLPDAAGVNSDGTFEPTRITYKQLTNAEGEEIESSEIETAPTFNNKVASSVKVTKAFSGINSLPDGFKIKNNYNSDEFTVSNAEGGDGKTTPYYWTITDVPVGTVIKFTESGILVDGYQLTVNGQATTTDSAEVTADATEEGTIKEAAFVNEYSNSYGSLTLKKSLGSGSPEQASSKQYKFTVTQGSNPKLYVQADGSLKITPHEFVVPVNNTGITIKNVPVGKYELTEDKTSAAITGYTLAVEGEGQVEVIKDGVTKTVKNTYTSEVGSLTLIKKLGSGAPSSASDKKYSFTVKTKTLPAKYVQEDGSLSETEYKFSVPVSTTGVKIENIPVGTYVVSEDKASAAITGYSLSVSGEGDVTVKKNATATKTVTNTYTNASLSVKKVILLTGGGTLTAEQKAKEFTMTVTLSDKTVSGLYGTESTGMTFKEGVATFKLKAGETKTATGLPGGITYKVEEAEANKNGYTTKYTNQEGTLTSGKTVTATVNNSYTAKKITVKKVWSDGSGSQVNRPSSIRVHLLANGTDTGNTVELSTANNWIYTWANLPANDADGKTIAYTVVEEAVSGYTAKYTGTATSGFTITNTKETPNTADHFNAWGWGFSFVVSIIASLISAIMLRRRK